MPLAARALLLASLVAMLAAAGTPPPRPWVVAHRGASAYAPENTIPAFMLAAEQGATFVELDVQRSKDGTLVLLHDSTLERTTDVETVFPNRGRRVQVKGEWRTQWPLEDFTLAELRTLDAGGWFAARYAGTRVPTFEETIAAVKGRTGLFIELKAPESYPGIEAEILAALKAAGLDRPWADPKTPVLLQSFTVESLRTLAALKTALPVHLLFGPADAARWTTDTGLAEARTFVTGLSPDKQVVAADPGLVVRAHARGMPVTPYTFRASSAPGSPDVRDEMRAALAGGIDGVITDNPDRVPQ